MRSIQVNSYSEGWLKKGFSWVYRNEVTQGRGQHGQDVVVRAGGRVLGSGIWDDQGKVAVRVFRRDEGPIDTSLIRGLVAEARERRRLPPATTAWRLLHGENDDLPGIRLDVWGTHHALALDATSLHHLVDPVLDAAGPCDAAWLSWRPPQGQEDQFGRLPQGLVRGQAGDQTVVEERGLRFAVHPGDGHDVGLFPDMRDLRAWLEPHWAGRSVLNTFAHSGAFSVAAARYGAARVCSVDLSERYLSWARRNFELNELDPRGAEWAAEDVFKALDRFRRKGELFDLVIADPPSFSHSSAGPWVAARDFPRLVSACLRVLQPGGWLVAATNQGSVSPKDFRKQIETGARKAERNLRLVHTASPPVDYPAALAFPESRYLKCWVLGT